MLKKGIFELRNIIMFGFCMFFILGTYKYVANGETYIFSTEWQDIPISLNDNVISQEIIIDSKAKWNSKSYAVYLELDKSNLEGVDEKGYFCISLYQYEQLIDYCEIPSAWLLEGFFPLKWLDFSKLNAGQAMIFINARDLNFTVNLGLSDNNYSLPNCFINGNDSGFTLTQQYHYSFLDFGYKLGLILFTLLMLITGLSMWILVKRADEKFSVILRINLLFSYLILVYLYDRSLFQEPTWAEAVTNFMHNSIYKSIPDCLFITDAGYLPFFQRLISITCFNILHLSPLKGLYAIQIAAYIISGLILSFLMKKQFATLASPRIRYICSLMLMVLMIQKETGAFINFITYGIFIIFAYFLVDSKIWSKFEFFILCIFGFLVCLSKGIYVTMFPFMVLCIVLFCQNYSKRDWIFSMSVVIGAFFQLLYYLNHGTNWINRTGTLQSEYYYLKLILGILVDVPNKLLGGFTTNIDFLNGISLIIIAGFWMVFIYLFFTEVLFKMARKKKSSRTVQCAFMMLIYIMAQTLFLRITIYGVNSADIISDEFWSFLNQGIDNRYQDSIFMAVAIFFAAMAKELKKSAGEKESPKYLIIVLLCLCTVTPRLQLKGLGNDNYSASKSKFFEMTSEGFLLEDLETTKCRVIPIQPNRWIYKHNAALYCFGTDWYNWKADKNIESNEPSKGVLKLNQYNVNSDIPIWQVFVKKNCLVNSSYYQISLFDSHDNLLLNQIQDNDKYQMLTSFTFDSGISKVASILITDQQGNMVNLDNTMYIVTHSEENYIIE